MLLEVVLEVEIIRNGIKTKSLLTFTKSRRDNIETTNEMEMMCLCSLAKRCNVISM